MRDLALAAVGAVAAVAFAAALLAALELADATAAILLAIMVLLTLEAGAVSAWRRGRRARPASRRRAHAGRPTTGRPSASPLAAGGPSTRRPRRPAATMLDELWRALP